MITETVERAQARFSYDDETMMVEISARNGLPEPLVDSDTGVATVTDRAGTAYRAVQELMYQTRALKALEKALGGRELPMGQNAISGRGILPRVTVLIAEGERLL